MSAASTLMTTTELLSLPENGVDRWLIAGKLRERPMTRRNRFHSHAMARLVALLDDWVRDQSEPRGEVLCGEAGIILSRNPDTTVGVDVTYVSAEVMSSQSDESTMIEGVPTLVVEILSPSDTNKDINEKIDVYLAAKVPVIWIIDPHRRNVTVYRPGKPSRLFNVGDELDAEPHLPGLRVRVEQVFD